jgi:hypothetical protein
MTDIDYADWLSEEDNRTAQLMALMEGISDDRSINVGWPTDTFEAWKRANREFVLRIETINRHAAWAGDYFSSLYHEFARQGKRLADVEASPFGAGLPRATLENLQAISILIGVETAKLESTATALKVRGNERKTNPAIMAIEEYRNRLMFDFWMGVRERSTARHRAAADLARRGPGLVPTMPMIDQSGSMSL